MTGTPNTPPFNPRLRNLAYYAFLATAAAVALVALIDLMGPWLSRPLGAAALIFVRTPVLGAGILTGCAGIVLSVVVRRDPRLYLLSMITVTLAVFWVRQPVLDVALAWVLLYVPGALLFSLRWWVTRQPDETPPPPPPASGPF